MRVRIAEAESPQTILHASPLHTGSEVILIAPRIAEIEVSIIGINRTYPASTMAFSMVHPRSLRMLM